MKSYTLKELTEYIHRVLALNFQEPLWVKAEILQVNHSRGHTYLELVEKAGESDQVSAQVPAVLWSGTKNKIKKDFPGNLEDYLNPGTEVSLLVAVTYHSVYGLKLTVQNIDPAYTLGKLELLKQRTLKQIQKEGLIGLNAEKYLPPVIQRIAIISSPTASGFQDFIQHLENNPFGYNFDLRLFPTAMQGANVLPELLDSLKSVENQSPFFDCAIIIRGGGSKLDLSAFDHLEISRAVAMASLPILTGIGHETDFSVVDSVSFKALKTPTAVAAFILDRNMEFVSEMDVLRERLVNACFTNLANQSNQVLALKGELHHASRHFLDQSQYVLQQQINKLQHKLSQYLQKRNGELDNLHQKLVLLNPLTVLKRGYSLTTYQGKILKNTDELKKGSSVETRLFEGSFTSEIKDILYD